MRYTKETKEKVVNAILKGELWLEEAMILYQVRHKRSVISWLRQYQLENEKRASAEEEEQA